MTRVRRGPTGSLWAPLLALVVWCASPFVTGAQSSALVGLQRATRAELATRAASLEGQLATAKKGAPKERISVDLAELRARLVSGDFRVGDRFLITLTLDSVRSDTMSVRDGLVVTISNLPDVSLKGVLRSELDDALTVHVLRYFKNARIRTVPLTQVSVLGAVGRPGFHWIAPDRPVSEIIMIAGGPIPDANLREMEVKRASRVMINPKNSRTALISGATLEQLDIRSGDEIRIPTRRKVNWGSIIQLMLVASSLFFGFIQFIQWYYGRKE